VITHVQAYFLADGNSLKTLSSAKVRPLRRGRNRGVEINGMARSEPRQKGST
jgi:hypothetical protein